MKFKVGDIVKIISDSYRDKPYKGKLGKIIRINNFTKWPITVHFNFNKAYAYWYFDEKEIELYKSVLKKFIEEMEKVNEV